MNKTSIKLYQPYALNEIGGRGNNEDCIFPQKGNATPQDRLFLVCDGVGGSNKGEVASSILCESIANYLGKSIEVDMDTEMAKQALLYAEKELQEHVLANPDTKNMASTLTFLYFNTTSAILMWAGDSRIYHFRDGQILYRTRDHSLVNHLVNIGEITEKEAENHSQRNVILKAVKGSDEPVRPEFKEITDIQSNDYFLLCTDGVLESFSDKQLAVLFNHKANSKQIIDQIFEQCQGRSRDNFSAYVVQVESGIKNEQKSRFNLFRFFKYYK